MLAFAGSKRAESNFRSQIGLCQKCWRVLWFGEQAECWEQGVTAAPGAVQGVLW